MLFRSNSEVNELSSESLCVSVFFLSNFLHNNNFSSICSVLFYTIVKKKSCNAIVCLLIKTGNYFTYSQSFFLTVVVE